MPRARMRVIGQRLGVVAVLVAWGAGLAVAQRPAEDQSRMALPLSPPNVSVSATPLTVTLEWQRVPGATSYTVEQSTGSNGPWNPLPFPGGTRLTAPTIAAWNNWGGTLYYYRVTALAPSAQPGITVVPRVTPQLEAPLGMSLRQDGADLVVSWAQVPHATGYVISAAAGQQLPPTQTVDVGAPSAEARLLNVASPTMPRDVWIAVNARYGTAGALSNSPAKRILLSAVQSCWPASSVPGAAPTVSITPFGPTSISVTTAKIQTGQSSVIRVDRAPLGSQAWQSAGCGYGAIYDGGLTPGTQYQYRVVEMASGGVGQAIVNAATPPAPDNPTPTAAVTSCVPKGCIVSLNFNRVAGAEEYRIESSYGLYQGHTSDMSGAGGPPGGPMTVGISSVPSGVHTFRITALFPPMRPSPRPPGQVTVVVP